MPHPGSSRSALTALPKTLATRDPEWYRRKGRQRNRGAEGTKTRTTASHRNDLGKGQSRQATGIAGDFRRRKKSKKHVL